MPSSMCWPCSVSRQRTSVSVSSANQSMRSPGFQTPDAVDPAAEVGRGGDVGADGHDVRGDLRRARGRGRRRSARTPAGWRPCRVCARPRSRGHRRRRRRSRPARARSRSAALARRARPRASPARSAPTGRRRRRRARPPAAPTARRVSSAEWLPGWPCGRQPPGLDRVGEEHRGAVGDGVGLARRRRAGRRGRGRRGRGSRARSSLVVEVGDQPLELACGRARRRAGARAARRVGAQQPLVLLVGHRVDARCAAPRRPRARTARAASART